MGKSKGKKTNPPVPKKEESKEKENKTPESPTPPKVETPPEKKAPPKEETPPEEKAPPKVENPPEKKAPQQPEQQPVSSPKSEPQSKSKTTVNANVNHTPIVEETPKKQQETEKTVEILKCAVCSNVSISKCGGCNKIAYCSRNCQKLHWKNHKNECVAWKISQSPELGRFLVAARDIKAGKIILQEKPLLVTPPKITSPICLGCYNELVAPDDETAKPEDEVLKPKNCVNACGWPMCGSKECMQNREDHEAECEISLARGKCKIQHFGQDHPMYQAVGVLRALSLKEKRPEEFAQLLNLQSNVEAALEEIRKIQEENEGNEEQQIAPQLDFSMSVSLILDFFHQRGKGITEELVQKLASIIETNGHEIPLPGNYGQLTRRLIGVYNTASFLEHNCTPNCVKSIDSETNEIFIRSAVSIKKGDHLSISYVDPLWGTNDRATFLKMTKFFSCSCKRCLDPTELNCHISSLRCSQVVHANTNDGMVVPIEPLNPESEWKCTSCEETYPVRYPATVVERIGREVEEFQEKRGDIAAQEEFIKKHSKLLPPNHFYFLELKVELAQLYGRTADEPLPVLAPQKLVRKIQLCEELLKVLNVIVPGYHRLRHLILYELQAGLSTLSKLKHSFGEIPTKMHVEELLKCRLMLIDVIKVLSWEPVNSVEYRRCEGAKNELRDCESLIKTLVDLQNKLSNPSSSTTTFFGDNQKTTATSKPKEQKAGARVEEVEDEEEIELF